MVPQSPVFSCPSPSSPSSSSPHRCPSRTQDDSTDLHQKLEQALRRTESYKSASLPISADVVLRRRQRASILPKGQDSARGQRSESLTLGKTDAQSRMCRRPMSLIYDRQSVAARLEVRLSLCCKTAQLCQVFGISWKNKPGERQLPVALIRDWFQDYISFGGTCTVLHEAKLVNTHKKKESLEKKVPEVWQASWAFDIAHSTACDTARVVQQIKSRTSMSLVTPRFLFMLAGRREASETSRPRWLRAYRHERNGRSSEGERSWSIVVL